MSKVILFIDGDNIDESYTKSIFVKANAYGDVYEAHCFSDFVKRKQRWESAYYTYKTQLHYIPGMDKQRGKADPNTSDIALTAFAILKLVELSEIDVCIIVANDKDYIPLAKAIREKFHKKAVMFYTEQNDKAISSYDASEFIKDSDEEISEVKAKKSPTKEASESVNLPAVADYTDLKSLQILLKWIENLFDDGNEVLLSELSPKLKDDGIIYNSLGTYLKKMFERYSVLSDYYVLKLSDKRDRIERKIK